MKDQDLNKLLKAVMKSSKIPDERTFRDGVWAKIDCQLSWSDRVRESLGPILPVFAWRAAPAALALVVGGVSGAALAQAEPHDDLAVFDSQSSYSIVAVVAPHKEQQ